jgi:heme/copper-type cytochrome/quinol oxidase subunit 2
MVLGRIIVTLLLSVLSPLAAIAQAQPAKSDGVPEGIGYLVMDVVAVVVLMAALAWGVWRYRASRRPGGRVPDR